MPAYIIRIAGTKSWPVSTRLPAECTSLLIDEEVDPSDFECAVIRNGYGIEFRKAGGHVNLIIGDPEGSEELETATYIYLTEDLYSDLREWR